MTFFDQSDQIVLLPTSTLSKLSRVEPKQLFIGFILGFPKNPKIGWIKIFETIHRNIINNFKFDHEKIPVHTTQMQWGVEHWYAHISICPYNLSEQILCNQLCQVQRNLYLCFFRINISFQLEFFNSIIYTFSKQK